MAASCLVTARGPALLSAQKGRQLGSSTIHGGGKRRAMAGGQREREAVQQRCKAQQFPRARSHPAPDPPNVGVVRRPELAAHLGFLEGDVDPVGGGEDRDRRENIGQAPTQTACPA